MGDWFWRLELECWFSKLSFVCVSRMIVVCGVWSISRIVCGAAGDRRTLLHGVAVCRKGDICKKCPNTAWLLFLMFALVLIALVAVSVYLSKKRLSLAILGIGVVRAHACHH